LADGVATGRLSTAVRVIMRSYALAVETLTQAKAGEWRAIKVLIAFGLACSVLVLATFTVLSWRSGGSGGGVLLAIGVIPLLVTALVGGGMLFLRGPLGRVAAIWGLVASIAVAGVAMVSFITPALSVVPTCAALAAACILRLQV
jgi:hypothetical protein